MEDSIRAKPLALLISRESTNATLIFFFGNISVFVEM